VRIQSDFSELLASFNARNVEYVIVGAYALAFHGAPRYTGDLDIFIKPDPENARRVLDALQAFGFGSVALTARDFEAPHRIIQLGVPPVGRKQFIANKRATGRLKDLADVEALGEA
jgi:hypothetical protein